MTDLITDRAGFPLLYVEPLEAYLHWLPISKVQFEYFLCSTTDPSFDQRWYERILSLNPRISPDEARSNNYWQTFLTGILPQEAQRFAQWCGEGYSVPTFSDWMTAYDHLKGQEPMTRAWPEELDPVKPRVVSLLEQVDIAASAAVASSTATRTLADQMFLRQGVVEWVALEGERSDWGGLGQPPRDFAGILLRPEDGQPARPREPEVERVSYFGFRLLCRRD